MTEHNSETEIEIEAQQADETFTGELSDEAFTEELSDEAIDRGQEGRYCLTMPTCRP